MPHTHGVRSPYEDRSHGRDAAQKAAEDAVRAERLARARADIDRTLAAARANAA
jgi:hypothetical protein